MGDKARETDIAAQKKRAMIIGAATASLLKKEK